MTTTPKHEAERLAEFQLARQTHIGSHRPMPDPDDDGCDARAWDDYDKSAEHLRRIPALEAENEALKEEVSDLDGLRDRLAAILKSTAIALRGPEPELTSWGWADLPERVAELKERASELEAQRVALTWQPMEAATENMTAPVVVFWQDSDGNDQHDFDYTEDGCWIRWHEHAEHVEVIGGHGVSYTPPYTYWMQLPPVEVGIGTKEGGQ